MDKLECTDDISYCNGCYCMTKTKKKSIDKNQCNKCGYNKLKMVSKETKEELKKILIKIDNKKFGKLTQKENMLSALKYKSLRNEIKKVINN